MRIFSIQYQEQPDGTCDVELAGDGFTTFKRKFPIKRQAELWVRDLLKLLNEKQDGTPETNSTEK